jgi:hypothetical protein
LDKKLTFVQLFQAVKIRPASTPETAYYKSNMQKRSVEAELWYGDRGVIIKQGPVSIVVPLSNVIYARFESTDSPEDIG